MVPWRTVAVICRLSHIKQSSCFHGCSLQGRWPLGKQAQHFISLRHLHNAISGPGYTKDPKIHMLGMARRLCRLSLTFAAVIRMPTTGGQGVFIAGCRSTSLLSSQLPCKSVRQSSASRCSCRSSGTAIPSNDAASFRADADHDFCPAKEIHNRGLPSAQVRWSPGSLQSHANAPQDHRIQLATA